MKYAIGISLGIVLNLWIALGSMDILMMLTVPVHKHSMCFHLSVSSFHSSMSYGFLNTGLLSSWLSSFLGTLFL